MSVIFYKTGRPPRQSFEFAPASVDEMKLDEAHSHLRAAAVLFAAAQADEMIHQFEAES